MSEDVHPTPPGGPTPPEKPPVAEAVAEPAVAHDPHTLGLHKHGHGHRHGHGHGGPGSCGCGPVPPHTHSAGDYTASPKTLRALLVTLILVSAVLLFLVGMIVGAHHGRDNDDRYHAPWVTHAYNGGGHWYSNRDYGNYAVPGAAEGSAAGDSSAVQGNVAPATPAAPATPEARTAPELGGGTANDGTGPRLEDRGADNTRAER
jgi:hypothetical protein